MLSAVGHAVGHTMGKGPCYKALSPSRRACAHAHTRTILSHTGHRHMPKHAEEARLRHRRKQGEVPDKGWNFTYAVDCYGAGSSFADLSCNCLSKPPHAAYDSRDTIVIVIGSWLAGAINAFLLKTVIEEVFGYPVMLVPDEKPWLHMEGWHDKDAGTMFPYLARGLAHIYPEVRACP